MSDELALPDGDGIRSLSDQDLEAYETRALSAIDARLAAEAVTADDVAWATSIEQQIIRVGEERTRRAADAAAPAAAADIRARLAARTATAAVGNPGDEVPEGDTAPVEGELVTADGRPVSDTRAVHRQFGGLSGPKYRLNDGLRGKGRNAAQTFDPYASGGGSLLSRAQQFAQVSEAERRTDLSVLVASADVPGFTQGGQLDSMDKLVRAMVQRARTLPISRGNGQRVPVAQAQRKYAHTIDHRADLNQITDIMAMATDPAILTAAGGWCAALEVIWDLYNIVCTDGAVDIPIIGTPRGGLSWPVSPSFGDISALPGVVWTWTNTMDVAAVTGTDQSGIKPCVRVPCPDYTQAVNDCDGVCVTVGNLTSDAFPELIANHLRLVEAIHAHYMNNRLILQMASAANSTPVTATQTDGPAAVDFLNVSAFYRRHLIEKYAMCDTAIFEGVYPRFAKDMIKNDLRFTGAVSPSDTFCVSDEMLADWLDCAGIRAQFVADWQVRATGLPGAATAPTAWPGTVNFMMYPAGTFAKLQGMTLDLGVVRDSTLNETNDHTAAWFEECWALAKIGHESLNITLDTCVNGSRGALDQTACTQV